MKRVGFVIVIAITLAGCGAKTLQEKEQLSGALPDWVVMPHIEGGLTDTQCVPNNAEMGILKGKAVAMARTELAKQLNLKVKAMDKIYASLNKSADGVSSGSSFESVSKHVTNQMLVGSTVNKLDYVPFPNGSQKFCAMISVSADKAKVLFDEIVTRSGRNIKGSQNSALYQEFKAVKAQEELEPEFET